MLYTSRLKKLWTEDINISVISKGRYIGVFTFLLQFYETENLFMFILSNFTFKKCFFNLFAHTFYMNISTVD